MSLFIIAIVVLPMIIVMLHSTVRSSFYNVIIQDKAEKMKIERGDKTPRPAPTEQDKIDEYLKISDQVRCINMTVNYLSAYLVFITVVYLMTIV
jgi:hypothetical protein